MTRQVRLLCLILAAFSGFVPFAAPSLLSTSRISSWLTLVLSIVCLALGRAATVRFLATSPRIIGAAKERGARLSARGLTELAAALAGRRRAAVRREWLAHLAGESGHERANWSTVKDASGFLVSVARFRGSDLADAAWTPADAVLRSRALSNLVVFGPTMAAALLIFRHDGLVGMLGEWESIAGLGATLYGLVRVGRWYRDVKPSEPKARRAKE